MIVVLIIVGLIVLIGIFLVVLYNGLVKLRNRIDNAWSQIDVQLKRRYDLIPNLVETVKGYAAHERETLEAVIQARNMAISADNVGDQAQAENMLSGALKSLFAVSEAYPDLKANQNFLNLQEELTGTEGRIAYARQFYNDTVLRYNTKIQTFPAVMIAGMFRFTPREYFEAEPESRENVQVSFDTPPPVAATPAPAPTPPAAAPAAPAPPSPPPVPPTDAGGPAPGTPPPA
ncbi:MAG TPA: LemA family protein [Acidimicrobiales bacterium]|nr:LemA family protein [Acidimicrobiales bacterium]